MNQRLAVCFAVVLCLAALIAAIPVAAAEDRPTERVSPAPQVNPNAVLWRTPQPPAKPQAGDVWVNPKDGMEMVYIAPGEFTLGTSDAQIDAWLKEHPADTRKMFRDEHPQCRVNLPGYWIGRTEVTNAQYLRFVEATGHRTPNHWEGGQVPSGLKNCPVVWVDCLAASAYCEWAGGHLPSELRWEKAARGADGRIFPWGNQWDSKRCRNNAEGPAAVGSYPTGASPYGCADMAGNVWEWCADWYDESAYQRYAKGDLTAPNSGEYMVLRGGSWGNVTPYYFRCADRNGSRPPGYRDYGTDDSRLTYFDFGVESDVGFRCARDASP